MEAFLCNQRCNIVGKAAAGSGFINNSAGGPTYCAWQNTTGSAQTIYGGNVCCRVPGR